MVLLSNFVAMPPPKPGQHAVTQSNGNGNVDVGHSSSEPPRRSRNHQSDVRTNGFGQDVHRDYIMSLQQRRNNRWSQVEPQENARTMSTRSKDMFYSPNDHHSNHHHHHHHHHQESHRRHSLQHDNHQNSLMEKPKYSLKNHRPSTSSQNKSEAKRSDISYNQRHEFEESVYTKMNSPDIYQQHGRKNGHVTDDAESTYMVMNRFSKHQIRLLGGSSDKSSSTHSQQHESQIKDNVNLQSQLCNSVNSGMPSHYHSDALIDAGIHNSRKAYLVKQEGNVQGDEFLPPRQMDSTFISSGQSMMTRSADFSSLRGGPTFYEESSEPPISNFPENGVSARANSSSKRRPNPLDISLTSTISNAESWSPSYVKMNFLFGSGSGDPIHHPIPRGSSDGNDLSNHHGQLQRSATEGDFRERSHSSNSRNIMKIDSGHGERNRSNAFFSPNGSTWDQNGMTRSLDFSSLNLNNGYDDMPIHHAKVFTPPGGSAHSRHSVADSRMTSSVHEDFPDSISTYGTIPRRGAPGSQSLRRSISHEPNEIKVKPLVIRTASDGEVESEYVTLDWRYQPLNGSTQTHQISKVSPESILSNSVLCPPTHENAMSSDKIQSCGSGSPSSKSQINRIKNPVFTNKDSNAKNDSPMTNTHDSKLVKTNPSMPQPLQTNTLPAKSKRSILKKRSSSTLQTVEEANVDSASSSSIQSSTGSIRASLPSFFHTLTNKSTHHKGNSNQNGNINVLKNKSDNALLSKSLHLDSYTSRASKNQKPREHQQKDSKQTHSDAIQPGKLIRSKSLPDLQASKDPTKPGDDNSNGHNDSHNNTNYSDDEDGDDFGFLSYPISFSSSLYSPSSSTAMQKAKSPSPSSRILPKRWRSKNKAVPVVTSSTAMWTPGPAGSCVWSSVSGRKVHLRPVSLLTISEAERLALQKIALSSLQNMAMECPLAIPKDGSEVRRSKKSALSLKRRSKSLSGSHLDTSGKEAAGLVFGIPLSKCIVNDRELEKKRRKVTATTSSGGGTQNSVTSPSSHVVVKMRVESADNLLTPRSARKSSSSSQGSLENSHGHSGPHNGTVAPHRQDRLAAPSHKRAASSDSLSESESSRNTSSSLIDALSLSTSHPSSRINSLAVDRSLTANHGELQVPYVVKACFRHIERYGLHTLGVFRVGCSKKRVKQLREEFDSGNDVELNEDHHPHDVAALLKEYFRDLPEPLLTRDLYLPFLHARRLPEEQKRSTAFSLLISMLPVVNRDTLWALLRFLGTVSQHAPDSTNDKGETISGNKMDTHNLATLFGPNVLHRTKSSLDKEGSAESAESVEQSKEVIEVVKDMIDNHHELYEISGSLRDEVLRLLIESDQETADRILKHLANQHQIEVDPESMSSVFEDVTGSPVLSHAMNSDADFFAYTKRLSTTAQRPLRVTKSVEDCLDSPVSKSRATHLSDSQVLFESDALKIPGSNTHPRLDLGHSYPSPLPNRVPILRLPHDSSASPEVVLRGRIEPGSGERPYSENYSQNLSIPRPLYLRENSSSSVSSCLSSSQNSHGGSDGNNHSGQWVLPTPPASRGTSPKPFFRSASSSSTLIATSSPARFNHSHSEDDERIEKNMPHRNAEWERERWRQWEMIASEKRNSEAEQETLV